MASSASGFYQRHTTFVRGLLSLAVGVAVWEIAARHIASPLIVVPPSRVFQTFVSLVSSGELRTHVYVSAQEFVLGFGLAAIVGVLLGTLIGISDRARDVLEPWLSALYATPVVAFAPLFVIWLGIDLASKVAVAFLLAALPVVINTSAGIRTADQNLIDVARSFSAKRRHVFAKILLPNALPFIIAGLRLGVGRAIIGIVVGEFFGARAGLGYMILNSAQMFDTSSLFVATVILAVTGMVSVFGLQALERRLAPWREYSIRT